MQQEIRHALSRNILIGTTSIFLFLTFLLIVSRLTVWFDVPAFLDIILASVLMLTLVHFQSGTGSIKIALISLLLFFLFLFLWAHATSPLYSPGDDEYAYHLTAIWDLAEGWNPMATPHNNIWVDSYPNGYWLLQSYIFALTGLLLSGQSLLVGISITTGILIFGFFLENLPSIAPKYKVLASLILAGIIVGNPIVLTQILTHYTDAPLYIIGCALAFFLITDAVTSNRLAQWGTIGCIILLINTKTANLYYVPLIVISGFILDLIIKKSETGIVSQALNWVFTKGLVYGFVSILATFVIGYKPYVTNVLDHLSLLYPAVDEIMSHNIPNNVQNIPTPLKFLYGIFSETSETLWPYPFDSQIYLKFPGTFSFEEFKYLRFDTRRGGFGPFFSLALLTSIFAYITCRIVSYSKSSCSLKRTGDGIAAFATLLFFMSMFFPESWWARYVPFTWLSAVLFLVSTFYFKGDGKVLWLVRALQGLAIFSFMLCILAGAGGTLRQNFRLYRLIHPLEISQDYSVIRIYIPLDSRITLDHQSKTVSDAAQVWKRILEKDLPNLLIYGTKRPDNEAIFCQNRGWLEAHVFWCIPPSATKIPPVTKK